MITDKELRGLAGLFARKDFSRAVLNYVSHRTMTWLLYYVLSRMRKDILPPLFPLASSCSSSSSWHTHAHTVIFKLRACILYDRARVRRRRRRKKINEIFLAIYISIYRNVFPYFLMRFQVCVDQRFSSVLVSNHSQLSVLVYIFIAI